MSFDRHGVTCVGLILTEMYPFYGAVLAAESMRLANKYIAGQGILYAEAWDELLEFVELTDTPVISTLNGKSCFPENHPMSLGCAGGARSDAVNRF